MLLRTIRRRHPIPTLLKRVSDKNQMTLGVLFFLQRRFVTVLHIYFSIKHICFDRQFEIFLTKVTWYIIEGIFLLILFRLIWATVSCPLCFDLTVFHLQCTFCSQIAINAMYAGNCLVHLATSPSGFLNCRSHLSPEWSVQRRNICPHKHVWNCLVAVTSANNSRLVTQ